MPVQQTLPVGCVCSTVVACCGAREWRNRQTRTVQVRVPERVWGFNSPLAHHHESPRACLRSEAIPCFMRECAKQGGVDVPQSVEGDAAAYVHSEAKRAGADLNDQTPRADLGLKDSEKLRPSSLETVSRVRGVVRAGPRPVRFARAGP